LSLCLSFNWAPRHEGMLLEWKYSSTHSLTSALDGGEWSASRPGRFTPRERAPRAHWIGGWVGPRAVLDAVVKRTIPSPRQESNPRTPIVQLVASRHINWATPVPLVTHCFRNKPRIVFDSRDSSVGIALGYGLDDRCSRVRFPAGTGNFSLHHRVQNSSGTHPASYPMGKRGSFPGVKAAGAWSWPLTSI
jgi:hypothetical protein